LLEFFAVHHQNFPQSVQLTLNKNSSPGGGAARISRNSSDVPSRELVRDEDGTNRPIGQQLFFAASS